MESVNRYEKLFKNIIWFLVGTLGNKIFSFVLVWIYANYLSAESFGLVDLVNSTALMLEPIFSVSIYTAVLRFSIESNYRSCDILVEGKKILNKGMVLLGTILLLISFFITSISKVTFLILFLLCFFSASNSIYMNYLNGTNKVPMVARGSILNVLCSIVLSFVLLVFLKKGTNGYFTAQIISVLITNIYYKKCIGKEKKEKKRPSYKTSLLKLEMLSYSRPMIFNTIAWWINSNSDKYFVTLICGMRANGIYSMAYRIPTLLTAFQNIFENAWAISASEEYAANDKSEYYCKLYSFYNSFIIIGCSLLVLINVPFIEIFFSEAYFLAWKYAGLLLVAVLFRAMGGFIGSIFSAIKETKIIAVSTIWGAGINVILNIILIYRIGAMGAAIATLVSYIIVWGYRIIKIKKKLNVCFFSKREGGSYLCLLTQTFFGLGDTHNYMIQLILISFMVWMNRSVLKCVVLKILKKSKQYNGSKGNADS